jgi:hypothetical protein
MQADLLVNAFANDLARVATLEFSQFRWSDPDALAWH